MLFRSPAATAKRPLLASTRLDLAFPLLRLVQRACPIPASGANNSELTRLLQLNSACATLHQGTYDFPRCETVFASKRVRLLPYLRLARTRWLTPARSPPFPRPSAAFDAALLGKQAFEIVTETEVHRAQRELAGQVEPQVKELIQRAEDGLEDLKRKEDRKSVV